MGGFLTFQEMSNFLSLQREPGFNQLQLQIPKHLADYFLNRSFGSKNIDLRVQEKNKSHRISDYFIK